MKISRRVSGNVLAAIAGLALLTACGGESTAPDGAKDGAAENAEQAVAGREMRILAFGNSLFAGYQVDEGQSYPAQLEKALRADGINARVINAGVSGDTSAAGAARIEFALTGMDAAPDLAIVELGGNDLLRGLSPNETRENLDIILTELRDNGVPVLLMGMRAPPNLGEEYVTAFDRIYPELAEKHSATLVPFFLEAIYDKPQLIQDDRIHPTAEGISVLVNDTVGDVRKALPKAGEAE